MKISNNLAIVLTSSIVDPNNKKLIFLRPTQLFSPFFLQNQLVGTKE